MRYNEAPHTFPLIIAEAENTKPLSCRRTCGVQNSAEEGYRHARNAFRSPANKGGSAQEAVGGMVHTVPSDQTKAEQRSTTVASHFSALGPKKHPSPVFSLPSLTTEWALGHLYSVEVCFSSTAPDNLMNYVKRR